jgi:hypothetical protein
MDPFKSFEQFVIKGYFDASDFKQAEINRIEYYDKQNDVLILRRSIDLEPEKDPMRIKWFDWFKNYLNYKSIEFYKKLTRSENISEEILIHEEYRLSSLIEKPLCRKRVAGLIHR